MKERLEAIRERALAQINETDSLDKLNDIRVAFLGKKGELTEVLKGMKEVAPEDRPKVGQIVNETRQAIEEVLDKAKTELAAKKRELQLKSEVIDVTLPSKRDELGHKHPNTLALEEIQKIFIGMGYEVVDVHEELRCCASAAQHTRNHEHHVDKSAAERLQICRSCGVAAYARCAADEPWVHRDRSTIVSERGFVVLIYKVVVKLVYVFISKSLAVHLLDTVGEQATVQADEARLREFADERSDVLVLHVGIGIVLRACGCVRCVTIVGKELEFFECLAILRVKLSIYDERLSHLEVALTHKSLLHLVLDILHRDAVKNINVADNLRYRSQIYILVH